MTASDEKKEAQDAIFAIMERLASNELSSFQDILREERRETEEGLRPLSSGIILSSRTTF